MLTVGTDEAAPVAASPPVQGLLYSIALYSLLSMSTSPRATLLYRTLLSVMMRMLVMVMLWLHRIQNPVH